MELSEMENEASDIWKKNLREFNDVMRLDSIIVRSMVEFKIEGQKDEKEALIAIKEWIDSGNHMDDELIKKIENALK